MPERRVSGNKSIWLGPRTGEAVAARGGASNLSGTIATLVDRYDEVCRRSLPELSDAEWRLILDACNGWRAEPAAMIRRGLLLQVQDAIEQGKLDRKWKVKGPALVERLQGLTYAEELAVVDACERWWTRVGAGEAEPPLPNAA